MKFIVCLVALLLGMNSVVSQEECKIDRPVELFTSKQFLDFLDIKNYHVSEIQAHMFCLTQTETTFNFNNYHLEANSDNFYKTDVFIIHPQRYLNYITTDDNNFSKYVEKFSLFGGDRLKKVVDSTVSFPNTKEKIVALPYYYTYKCDLGTAVLKFGKVYDKGKVVRYLINITAIEPEKF